ncbi:carbohydrate ABC transporter substrate-binding protein (CUT1 family) [Melghirimyces profundicolus]|uniref:Carbohydrate ABC transporter substrate-binding protein (CUT1 family) n=1 Tax=Melghirimyces profundicolus TaxID=1242148 RepID=A0A2T6ATG9_9BACL|nr:ABC transporter substrate-binding protein [Melghirimyces profundicolus]PTX47113.1 carbohydrate ABC transporter substrate-binding protein (CUT1 family) [Melghirimyces profundicolus]
MKKILFFVFAILLAITTSGCSATDGSSGNTGGKSEDTVTLTIFNNKVEIAEQLNQLKKEYEASHPKVKLQITTVGGSGDYSAALKARFAASEVPDIFVNKGNEEARLWKDKLLDMSDEPWVEHLLPSTREAMTVEGNLLGMPVGIEGYGYIYNKDLFEKAGIKKLPTTLSELEETAKTLEKHDITAFSNGYQEYWILGNHLMNVALAKQDDPSQFITDWKEGKATAKGNPIFEDWVNLIDLTVKYGQKNPLTTDYNTQVQMFANGETAMLQQGNWSEVMLDKLNPDMNIGFLPMPINNDPKLNDNIFVGVPMYWVVHKESPHAEEAKEFLNWLVSKDIGKQYIVKEFKFIPAFDNIPFEESDLGQLASSTQDYVQKDKTLGWYFNDTPVGANKEFASSIQRYISGDINKDELLTQLDKTVQNLAQK